MSFFKPFSTKYLDNTKYNHKIDCLTYNPSNIKIELKDCYDQEQYKKLIEKIDNSSLSQEKKSIYKLLATKFIIFNYQNIAEYYCNIENNVERDLFERLAFVIIDIEKAWDYGFIKNYCFIESLINSQRNGKNLLKNREN